MTTKTIKLNRDCQFTHTEGKSEPATWDAKSRGGPWAYMCDTHFKLMAHPGWAAAACRLEREDEEVTA